MTTALMNLHNVPGEILLCANDVSFGHLLMCRSIETAMTTALLLVVVVAVVAVVVAVVAAAAVAVAAGTMAAAAVAVAAGAMATAAVAVAAPQRRPSTQRPCRGRLHGPKPLWPSTQRPCRGRLPGLRLRNRRSHRDGNGTLSF